MRQLAMSIKKCDECPHFHPYDNREAFCHLTKPHRETNLLHGVPEWCPLPNSKPEKVTVHCNAPGCEASRPIAPYPTEFLYYCSEHRHLYGTGQWSDRGWGRAKSRDFMTSLEKANDAIRYAIANIRDHTLNASVLRRLNQVLRETDDG